MKLIIKVFKKILIHIFKFIEYNIEYTTYIFTSMENAFISNLTNNI